MLQYQDFLKEHVHTLEEAKVNLMVSVARRECTLDEVRNLESFLQLGFVNEAFDVITSVDEASFAEKFREMADKAKEKAKEYGDKAKDKIGQGAQVAAKFGGNIMSALKAVLEKIVAAIKKMWDYSLQSSKSAVEALKERLLKELKPKLKAEGEKKKLAEELKHLKEIGAAAGKYITTGFVEAAAKSSANAAKTDESFQQVLEAAFYNAAAQVINEGYSLDEAQEELQIFLEGGGGGEGIKIPFVTSVIKKLSQVPPFKQLHDIEHQISKSAEKGLNGFSQLATKVAEAPGPFTFPVMAGIVGIIAGYMVEQGFKKGLTSIDGMLIKALGVGVPGFGIIYKFLKYGGIALAVYGLIEQLAGSEEKKPEKKEAPTA